jgi:hypothetical protein
MAGETRGTSVGGFAEDLAAGAVLGVGLEFVLHVGDGTDGVAFVEAEGAVAVFATDLGVFIEHEIDDALDLPERLIAATGADAPTFHFTLEELFLRCSNFGGHSLLSWFRLR